MDQNLSLVRLITSLRTTTSTTPTYSRHPLSSLHFKKNSTGKYSTLKLAVSCAILDPQTIGNPGSLSVRLASSTRPGRTRGESRPSGYKPLLRLVVDGCHQQVHRTQNGDERQTNQARHEWRTLFQDHDAYPPGDNGTTHRNAARFVAPRYATKRMRPKDSER